MSLRKTNNRSIVQRIEDLSGSDGLSDINKRVVSREFNVPISQVESISSFYEKTGSEERRCTGLPCSLKSYDSKEKDEKNGRIRESSCLGYCDHAPVVLIKGRYFRRDGNKIKPILESTHEYVSSNRTSIDEYITEGGYDRLEELLTLDANDYVIKKIENSSLRGMGGAGFKAYLKWKSFRQSEDGGSYLLINAHEGEPGTFKDREILERNPHSVLEGAIIAAMSNGIQKVVMAVKNEYILARWSFEKAVEELKVKFGQGRIADLFPEVLVKSVGGTYVTGEETALMEALEGKRSEPRIRPPFPTERGLNGVPTLVHNVETLSLIPEILRSGGNSLTKTYCLTGDVEKTGAIREKLGLNALKLVREYGGTDPERLKAFMPGGLSGGVLPASYMDLKLDSDDVHRTGAGFGTGAFIALSSDRCIVDVSRSVSSFFEKESCGKCAPCRLGTRSITEFLDDLAGGNCSSGDLEKAKETAESMIQGSLCALGQAAGKMFLDSISHFQGEYDSHLNGVCPEGVCNTGGGRK